MIPERNNYWLLDKVAGWQMTPDPGTSDITLDPYPGNATLLPSELVKSIACPVALAADANGSVFVMDGATNRITVLNLTNSLATRIEAFGGVGSALRRFKKPQSLTVLPSGDIAIVGASETADIGVVPDRSMIQLHAEAGSLAVAATTMVYSMAPASSSVLTICATVERFWPMAT